MKAGHAGISHADHAQTDPIQAKAKQDGGDPADMYPCTHEPARRERNGGGFCDPCGSVPGARDSVGWGKNRSPTRGNQQYMHACVISVAAGVGVF
jgi:hypothetical protein